MPVPTTASTFDQIMAATENKHNVRRALQLLVLVAPKVKVTTIPTAATLMDATGKLTIPTGFEGLGILNPKGCELTSKADVDGIEGYNYGEDVRRDTVKITRTLGVTAMEAHRQVVQSILRGIDLSTVALDPTTKTLSFDEPSVPFDREWVGLVLVRDRSKATGAEIIEARIYPSMSLDERSKESLTKKGAQEVDLQFATATDTTVGSPCRHILGAPGFSELYPTLGYAAAA